MQNGECKPGTLIVRTLKDGEGLQWQEVGRVTDVIPAGTHKGQFADLLIVEFKLALASTDNNLALNQ